MLRSGKVAAIASKLLKDPKTTKSVKSVAASALSQVADKRKLGIKSYSLKD